MVQVEFRDDPSPPAAEALRLFSACDVVVAVHGAGLANAVFMAEGKHVIELTLPEPHAHYYSHMVCTPNNPPKARATP